MNMLSEDQARRTLIESYQIPSHQARRVIQIARENQVKVAPWEKGAVTVRLVGRNSFTVENGAPEVTKVVASKVEEHYTRPLKQGRSAQPGAAPIGSTTKGRAMPKRGAAAAAEVEPEETETVEEAGARDYTVYADKPISATMQDFHDWLMEEVGDLSEMEPARIVALAGTLRMEFQKSEFNQERREERRAAREAAVAAEPEEAEEEKPAKPVRGAAKATAAEKAAAKPATARRTGAAAGRPAARATDRAARRGAKPAAAAEAPY